METPAFARDVTNASAAARRPDDDREVERLRLLIDRQPTCLVRASMEGRILAANDAALGQLAANHLGQALGHRFTEWMLPHQRDRWLDLAKRVHENGAASVECDLLDLAGSQHAVQLRGISQSAHPDGVESMVVAVRETSGVNRLERALQEHESTSKALAGVQARLEAEAKEHAEASDDRRRLQGELEEARADKAQLEARLAEHEAAERRQQARQAEEIAQLDALLAGAVRSVTVARRLVQAAPGAAPKPHAPEAVSSAVEPDSGAGRVT